MPFYIFICTSLFSLPPKHFIEQSYTACYDHFLSPLFLYGTLPPLIPYIITYHAARGFRKKKQKEG